LVVPSNGKGRIINYPGQQQARLATTEGWPVGGPPPVQKSMNASSSPDWLKFKNPAARAVRREAEEDWGR